MLDAITERALFDRLISDARGLADSHGTIVVLVSHRYATVRAADLIIVDVFPRMTESGYYGDMTRTFLKGRASEPQRAFEALRAKRAFMTGTTSCGPAMRAISSSTFCVVIWKSAASGSR